MADAEENADFRALSDEYAQALEALRAIQTQADTLLMMGEEAQLEAFLDQFVAMANRALALAEKKGADHFVQWFRELIEQTDALRRRMIRR